MHGTRDHTSTCMARGIAIRPGVPRLPPGAFWYAVTHAPKTVRSRGPQEAPGGNPGTPGMKTSPSTMLQTPHVTAPQRPHAWHTGSHVHMHGTRDRDSTRSPPAPAGGFLVCGHACPQNGATANNPRSPGWKPGDSGYENLPVAHAPNAPRNNAAQRPHAWHTGSHAPIHGPPILTACLRAAADRRRPRPRPRAGSWRGRCETAAARDHRPP
jgi:hypothetical protein